MADRKNFGVLLGALVVGLVALGSWGTSVFADWDRSVSDLYFRVRDGLGVDRQQQGVVVKTADARINSDILILGVDDRALDTFGAWPFPRQLHGSLLDSLSRISDQTQRERAVYFDFFFLEPSAQAENDALLAEAAQSHGRVLLETIHSSEPSDPDAAAEEFHRLDALQQGRALTKVTGDWKAMDSFPTIQVPLAPLGAQAALYGAATLIPDPQDGIFRRQNLVSKVTQVVETFRADQLKADESSYGTQFQRYVYTDKNGLWQTLPEPLSASVVAGLPALLKERALPVQVDDGTGTLQEVYLVQKVQDRFLPSVTLSLALAYWHRSLADVEVHLGQDLVVPAPELWNAETSAWEPAPFAEVRIPVDAQGAMVINYRGPRSSADSSEYQTYPVRSYAAYAGRAPSQDPQTWPESRQLAGKLLMVGAFATGIADDEKDTPFGQMYGVELHANALNTILTRQFLTPVSPWITWTLLTLAALLLAWTASRAKVPWSLGLLVLLIVGGLLGAAEVFDSANLVFPFAEYFTALLVTFLVVAAFRILSEEKEKRQIRDVFSKYVPPEVVPQLLRHPPELGGTDREMTVLFSDIRGFTALSEGLRPQELVQLLNKYFTAMTEIIHSHGGTVDKFVGDAIMCFWGAPLDQPNHAVLAARCAVQMIERLERLNRELPSTQQIAIGVGLNSGTMTVGNMGSDGRMNYTIMGDEVNLGARLEGTNKAYHTAVIISESTRHHLGDEFVVRELDNIRVQGKRKPVLIYELVDWTGQGPSGK